LPGNDPVDMRLGHSLEMRLESHGKALRGARVLALSRAGADVESTAYETDDNGMLFVKIDRRGFWLIRAAQMTRCEGCMDADWVSAFTSYTFDNEGGAHKTTTLPPTMSSTRDASLPRAVLVVSLLAAAGAALVRSTSKRVQKNPSRAPGS
jgi:hypothetical protein